MTSSACKVNWYGQRSNSSKVKIQKADADTHVVPLNRLTLKLEFMCMGLARLGLKVKVIGQDQGQGLELGLGLSADGRRNTFSLSRHQLRACAGGVRRGKLHRIRSARVACGRSSVLVWQICNSGFVDDVVCVFLHGLAIQRRDTILAASYVRPNTPAACCWLRPVL